MITAATLRSRTVKDLAAMAKKKGVPGWHAMRKEQLVRALLKRVPLEQSRGNGSRGSHKAFGEEATAAGRVASLRAQRRVDQIRAKLARAKDLAHKRLAEGDGLAKDRLVVMVRDPFWLHAYWELSRATVERARAALGQHWHGAQPILRLIEVSTNGMTTSARTVLRDIEIHGGVNNWYIDVAQPPKSFQVEIGYRAAGGRFISLAKSNIVSTTPPRQGAAVDGNWIGVAEDFDRIYAMSGGYKAGVSSELKEVFEEQLHRPMGTPMATRFGLGAAGLTCDRQGLTLEVDAELVVFGATDPHAHVTLKGKPVRLQEDGTFTMRFALPDQRQVLPVVASSGDGVEQRTVVLAVERNTKTMEPVIREPDE